MDSRVTIMWIEDDPVSDDLSSRRKEFKLKFDQTLKLGDVFRFNPSRPGSVGGYQVDRIKNFEDYIAMKPFTPFPPDLVFCDFKLGNTKNIDGLILGALHIVNYPSYPCALVSATSEFFRTKSKSGNSRSKKDLIEIELTSSDSNLGENRSVAPLTGFERTASGIEELLKQRIGVSISQETGTEPKDLVPLIRRGTKNLRESIRSLENRKEIWASLQSLSQLRIFSVDREIRFSDLRNVTFDIWTSLGKRSYLLQALFFDVEEDSLREAIKSFQEGMDSSKYIAGFRDASDFRRRKLELSRENMRDRLILSAVINVIHTNPGLKKKLEDERVEREKERGVKNGKMEAGAKKNRTR